MLFEWRVRWLQRSTAHMLAAMMVIAIFTLLTYLLLVLTTSLAIRLTG